MIVLSFRIYTAAGPLPLIFCTKLLLLLEEEEYGTNPKTCGKQYRTDRRKQYKNYSCFLPRTTVYRLAETDPTSRSPAKLIAQRGGVP